VDALDAFFADHARKVWSPGVTDCCLAVADWAIACGHPDPAVHLRETYDCEAGFRAIISSAGGVTALVESCAAAIGGRRVNEPMRGAIGVIGSLSNVHRQFGAIHDGAGWRVRFVEGFFPMLARPLAMWEI